MFDAQEQKTIVSPVSVTLCDDPEDEARLIVQAQNKDIQAFELLIGHYQKAVYNFALYLIHDRDHAADIAQEAFLKVFRSLKHFRGDSTFKKWLFRIVRNVFLDEMRKHHNKCRDKKVDFEALQEQVAVAEDGTDQYIVKQVLCDALEKLTFEMRTALIMYELQGFSYEEISEIEGVGLGTIKSRIFKARKKLVKDKGLLECWSLLQ